MCDIKKLTVPMIACYYEVLIIGSTRSLVVTLYFGYACCEHFVNTLLLELCHI
jgi:hypothetical protein